MKTISQSSFIRFFTKLPQLLFAGLLFSIPFAFFTGLFVFIGFLTGFNNIIIWGLGIIPSAPFFSGLIMIIRKYSVDKQDISIINTFIEATKENFKKSIVNGVLFYAIIACSVFSIMYYGTLAKTDVVFGSVLTLYILFAFLLLIMMFYIPILTVTYELKIRDIYKNSFLLVFGKILRNLIALLPLLVLSAVAFLSLLYSEGFLFWIALILTFILYPMIAAYIVNSIIAKGIQETVGYFTGNNVQYYTTEPDAEEESYAIENADSTSDYIFVNGRMIKNKNKSDNDEK